MDLLSMAAVQNLCESYGLYAVFALIMLESMGVPMPGETILIVAGAYAGVTHRIAVFPLIATASAAAIIGDNIGYVVGRTLGQHSLRKYGPRLGLDLRRIEIGRHLFLNQGKKIVFFGRFVAFLRAFAALLAGANRMRWPSFLAMNALGGICWATIVGGGAYLFGGQMERAATFLSAVLLLAAVALIVGAWFYAKQYERNLLRHVERSEEQATAHDASGS